jgi:murein DD-endopeptidase MepM/ murein hydrolase activator NlpD
LEFSRISSGFSLARFHPILQKWRAHKGVDYAAPIGTRVKSTADAIVTFAGTMPSYGNVVILQHSGGISTVYGHLSHITSGLHKGVSVTQGEVIGLVGMSGLATGPHLHYEFRVHGEHQDPLKVAMPNAVPVPNAYQADFEHHAQPLFAELDLLRGTNTASLD